MATFVCKTELCEWECWVVWGDGAAIQPSKEELFQRDWPARHFPRWDHLPDARYSTPNRWTVSCRYVSPGRSTVEGNSGRLGESGKCCVSRQKPACFR